MINTGKKFTITFIISTIIILLLFVGITYVFDPFFHYHKPYDWVTYELTNQRYQNDGIVRHFNYDAIITGSSLTDNFKTSELDSLFDVNSIKVPFNGGSFREIKSNLEGAFASNNNVKMVVWSIDLSQLYNDADLLSHEDLPYYLYDNLLFNDVSYWFNKTIFVENTCSVIIETLNNNESTSFDDYSIFYNRTKFSKKAIDRSYQRPKKNKIQVISKQDKLTLAENIQKNYIDLISKNENVQFYLFLPPTSIYDWDEKNQRGNLDKRIYAIEYCVEKLLELDNVHLYSFINEFDTITDLENYKDTVHYSEKINSKMLVWMKEGKDLLTKDNYKNYLQKVKDFYTTYAYDALFNN